MLRQTGRQKNNRGKWKNWSATVTCCPVRLSKCFQANDRGCARLKVKNGMYNSDMRKEAAGAGPDDSQSRVSRLNHKTIELCSPIVSPFALISQDYKTPLLISIYKVNIFMDSLNHS